MDTDVKIIVAGMIAAILLALLMSTLCPKSHYEEARIICLEMGYPRYKVIGSGESARYFCVNAYESVEIDLDKE